MEIRQATVADARLLAELNQPIQRQHAEHRPDLFKQPVMDDAIVSWYYDVLAEPDNRVYIACVGNVPVGYIVAEITRRPENPYNPPRTYIVIDTISINPEHHRKGYGKRLIQTVFELAQSEGISRLTLNVWTFNGQAIEFYERLGFRSFQQSMEIELG